MCYSMNQDSPKFDVKELLLKLKERFHLHMHRHPSFIWRDVKQRLENNPSKLKVIYQMEVTGGEPDVIDLNLKGDELMFIDCSKESPIGRRSLCYDHIALESRKKFPPKDSALHMAQTLGFDLLDEALYRKLQVFGPFDTKTSSWIKTPDEIRSLKGALFCDFRYGQTFTYHNGADSYYESRGFRGFVKV